MLKSVQHHLEGVSDLSPSDLANHVNTAFLAPTVNFEPLSYNSFRDSSVPSPDNSASRTKKKENVDLLTEPVTEILNTSYFENCLPSSWKEADVVPVPKQTPIKDVN